MLYLDQIGNDSTGHISLSHRAYILENSSSDAQNKITRRNNKWGRARVATGAWNRNLKKICFEFLYERWLYFFIIFEKNYL